MAPAPKPAKGATRHGLILTLGGAPPVDHVVGNLDGHFRPDRPTPVGRGCPVSLKRARELDADEGCPLELVEIPANAGDAGSKE